ncbi:MAG: RibD family protein [Candidatus Thermoplasmatota archaeon]|jgi:riboflavin-specific deaminase-like protein|nr:RibD family protein [Candidatus Thermoplasmatota archaeon]
MSIEVWKMRPEVTINVAQSLNGYISGKGGKRVSISNAEDAARVDTLRAESDAILVGANTVILDNPTLRVRNLPAARQPIRVVLDSKFRIKPGSSIFEDGHEVIIFTSRSTDHGFGKSVKIIREDDLGIANILARLHDTGIRKVLVEGGSNVISQFVETGLFDRFFVFIGNIILPAGSTPLFQGKTAASLSFEFVSTLGDGILIKLFKH